MKNGVRLDGKPYNNPNDVDSSGLLFNVLRKRLGFGTDEALAHYLGMSKRAMSNTRHGREVVGPTLILRVHEQTGMPVKQIRQLIAGIMPEGGITWNKT